MSNCSHESVEDILLQIGSKNTPNRRAVLDVFFHETKPLSIKDIQKKIKDKITLDQVTLYRIITFFIEKGIIKQIDFGHGQAYYEIIDHKNDHHHIICTSCHKVVDFVGCDSAAIIEKVMKQTKDFATISHHSFELFGLCISCNPSLKKTKK